jgi:hypothetical protein
MSSKSCHLDQLFGLINGNFDFNFVFRKTIRPAAISVTSPDRLTGHCYAIKCLAMGVKCSSFYRTPERCECEPTNGSSVENGVNGC